VLDPDQQLPHVAPVPSLLLLIRVHAARKSPLRMFSSVIANDDRLHDPVVARIGLFRLPAMVGCAPTRRPPLTGMIRLQLFPSPPVRNARTSGWL
jgi:hypothetical protein